MPPGVPFPIPNVNAPTGFVGLDNVTGANGASNVANYTPVSTNGTGTITTGRSTPGGIFMGAAVIALGTAATYQAFDVVVSGTTTTTNPLTGLLTASALGQVLSAAPAGVGVRFLGSLVYVTTGTGAGTFNTLWD